jgi:hypothetical protein
MEFDSFEKISESFESFRGIVRWNVLDPFFPCLGDRRVAVWVEAMDR